jgi:Ankyrin repeats (3 copies)
MLAVKRGHIVTLRTILGFGVNPALCLLKDADGSTPLHIAAQNSNSALVQVLLQHGPAEHAFTENSVGQTPLEISGLKGLPRVMGSTEAPRPTEPNADVTYSLRNIGNTAPFDLEKKKVQIPKLRVTLDALLADGRLVRGTKLATELLSFAARLERKLAIEVVRKNAAGKDDEEDDVDPMAQISDPTRTYALLRDAAASHPKRRRLVHLTDVQRSVQRSLEQQAERSSVSWNQQRQSSDEEPKEADPEEERLTQLKARSLFKSASGNYRSFGYNPKNEVNLFGNDQF